MPPTDRDQHLLIARLDERSRGYEKDIAELKAALLKRDEDIADLRKELEALYVKKEMFQPVQKAVFTLAGFIVLAVITAVLGVVLPKH
jgi:uncharacterized coiled-coil protein SlyX